ncbi:Reverse transcriptase (RNA-dependent DNA polymerase) [Popillia japonica]|uniref:Reverse transcriptase (RNA-dependent DNA polymerase) n=1 Tax=Popillia japonica TaxID=7064 RepID=A0AAW1N101_POPJA
MEREKILRWRQHFEELQGIRPEEGGRDGQGQVDNVGAAFDSVDRKKLISVLEKHQIPGKLTRLVKMTLHQSVSSVRVDGAESENVEVGKGLRQGDPLSTLLGFSRRRSEIATSIDRSLINEAIRNSNINRQETLINRSHQCLAYANDVVLIARGQRELELITSMRVVD